MSEKMDEMRANALEMMERRERNYKLAFAGAAVVEAFFLAAFLFLADFSNRLHLLLFIASLSIYTILIFGLLALGSALGRQTQRVLVAIDLLARSKV